MQINISGHHLELTDALKNYVEEKLARLSRHTDYNIIHVNVILSVEKLLQKAEASLRMRGNELFANETAEDLYAAIDGMVDKLDRQIIKRKEKLQSH